MTAPRAREHANPPSPPDRRPPHRGGGASPSTYAASAARRTAALARLRGARRGLARSARMLAATALLALSGALALPATAQAQTATTLVSNIGQGSTSTRVAGINHAQRFTTGSHGTGYTLSSVDVVYDDAEGDSFAAQVCTVDADGHPTLTCTDLEAPGSFAAGTITFTAPTNTVLAPGTTYTVVLTRPSFGVVANTYGVTTADGEDAGQATGWSIANAFEYWAENLEPDDWATTASGLSLRIAIKGSEAPPPDVTLHLSDEDGSVLENAGWVTVTATVSPASPVPFTVTVSADPVAPATEDDFRLSTDRVLSFAANATESTGTVRIRPVDDDNPEPDDVVRVSGAVSNEDIPDPDDVTLTIVNEDAEAFDVAVSAPTAVDEDAGTATVTVTLTTRKNSAPVIDVDLYYYWRPETATRGEDYRPPPGEVFTSNVLFATVPTSAFSAAGTAYVANRTFTIGIVDDQEAEADETIVFFVRTSSDTSPDHTITIRDDDTPVMRNVTLVSGPGSDGVWSTGERVELEVRYTLPVVVEQPEECWSYNADGTCKPPGLFVAVLFRSDARPGYGEGRGVALVPYESGSGTATLLFAYTVGADEDGARGVEVVDGKVLLRGATIRPLGGGDAELSEYTVTQVMQVTVRKPSGGAWTAGDAVRVNVRFTGPEAAASNRPPNRDKVEVNDRGGTPSIGLRLGDAETRTLARAAQYMGGSGSNTLRFEYEVTTGDGQVSAAEVVADSLARNGATIRNEQGYDAELDHVGVLWYSYSSLRVRDAAAREGGTLRFTMELAQAAKAPVTVDYETADGTATAGEDYTAKRGTMTFAPGHTRKTVAVPVLRDGAAEDAETVVLRLSNARSAGSAAPVEVTVAEAEGTIEDVAPEAPSGGLTARVARAPAEHNGRMAFTLRIAFSEPIRMSGRRLRADVVAVAGGRATKARPVNGRKDRWDLTVKPASRADVTITLAAGAACDTPAAVCTKRQPRRPLTTTLATTVPGPVALTVADVRAEEGTDETLDFAVSLSRAASRPVRVAYATADGTARAGADYTRTRGTLKFAPGETVKTVRVPVLDDAHDEGEETLQLRLSAASAAVIADGVATGTIENTDHLQRAWLARFGRTAATHVTDAVSDRLRGTPGQESHLTVGGYRLPLGQPDADGAEPATQADSLASLMTGLAGVLGLGSGHAGGTGVDPGGGGLGWDAWPNAGRDPRLGQSPSVNLDLRRLLLGSSFRLSLGAAATGSAGPRLTAWGRVAGTTFDGRDGIDGRDGTLSLNGDVLTGTVGVDGEWDRLLAGLAVAHSRGDGSYTMPVAGGDDSGNLEQTLTSVHPYLRYAVNDRLDVWGLFGYGWGELDLEMDDGMTIETDTNLVMGAFGGRGILLSAAEAGGFQIATRTDAMLTRTTSDKVAEMESAEADAHRLRLVLEGSRGFAWAEGRRLTPTMEVGLRHDWGDAETGFGLELGGRVQYADPALGLTIDAAVRGLLAHEDSDYQEWGASGTVRIDPGAGGQGLALTLAPAWGATASGVDGLWSRQTTAGLAPQGNRQTPAGRLNAEVGYGFAPFGAGLLTPYAGTVLSDGAARTYRVGGRLQLNGGWATGLNLNLEGMRQEPAGQQPVNQGLRLQVTWGF